MSPTPAIHVAEYARNFRLTLGSGRARYCGFQAEPSGQPKRPRVKGDANSASHPFGEETKRCSVSFLLQPSPRSLSARRRSLRRPPRPGGMAVAGMAAGIMAGMAVGGAGVARA